MLFVDIFVGFPLSRQERMFLADNLAIEVGCQGGIFIRQAFDFQIPAQEWIFQIHVLKHVEEIVFIDKEVLYIQARL